MFRVAAAVFAFLLLAGPLAAQDTETDTVFGETQDLISSIQEQLERMAKRAQARDGELRTLSEQIDQATALLGDRGSENSLLRQKNEALSEEVGATAASKDELTERLRRDVAARESAISGLSGELSELQGLLTQERLNNEQLRQDLAGLSTRNQTTLGERDRLTTELNSARAALAARTQDQAAAGARVALIADLRDQVGGLKELLAAARQDKGAVQVTLDKLKGQYQAALSEKGEFEARLIAVRRNLAEESATTEDRVAENLVLREEISALKGEIAERNSRLDELGLARTDAQSQNVNLNRILSDLSGQLQGIKSALETSEAQLAARDANVSDLQNRLEIALAAQFDELAEFRADLFDALRGALGERPDIRHEQNRLILQSELLFGSGSAEISPRGQRSLKQLAQILMRSARVAPAGIDWVFRVDGHTDRRAPAAGSFASNWDLSAQRALTVVQYLSDQGVPPARLAAVGFGPHRPLDPNDDEIADRRNRRMEFHLVEK